MHISSPSVLPSTGSSFQNVPVCRQNRNSVCPVCIYVALMGSSPGGVGSHKVAWAFLSYSSLFGIKLKLIYTTNKNPNDHQITN